MTKVVGKGEVTGDVDKLMFWNPDHFVARKLHRHAANWVEIAKLTPPLNHGEVLSWIENKVRSQPAHGKTLNS